MPLHSATGIASHSLLQLRSEWLLASLRAGSWVHLKESLEFEHWFLSWDVTTGGGGHLSRRSVLLLDSLVHFDLTVRHANGCQTMLI